MRPNIVLRSILFSLFFIFSSTLYAVENANPLPSWNEGPVKKNILDFVQRVTDETHPEFVPANDRIAVFDNDGTLWVEQPIYTQERFMIEQFKSLAKKHPEWKKTEPYKSILAGNYQNLADNAFDILYVETSRGLTVEEYKSKVNTWLQQAINERYKVRYTELIYQPMVEVMNFLRANDFKVYIVSGGGQDFIRAFAYETYGVDTNHVVGTTTGTHYSYKNKQASLTKLAKLIVTSNYAGKAEAINLFIGKKPIIAFGNADGDREMLEWTQSNGDNTLMLLVHHDDARREYSYDAHSKIGTFSKSLMKEAKENHWQVISMKEDWKMIFPFENNIIN